MPTYTYACEHCGAQFDIFQKFAEDPLTQCTQCGKESLQRVYRPVRVVFKGSGFYATDNRSASGMAEGSRKEKGGGESSEGGSSTSPSSDSGSKPSEKTGASPSSAS